MGRLAVGGDAVSLGFFILFVGLVATGQTGGDTFFSNPWLWVPIVLAGAAAITAGIVGLVCIFTHRDRSLPVVSTVVIGAIVFFWVIAEITFPH